MESNRQRIDKGLDKLLLGSHVPMKTPAFLLGSAEWALNMKATAFMVFMGPPRNTKECDVSRIKAPQALALWEGQGRDAKNIAVHFRYVLNPSSPDEAKGRFAADFFDRELTHMEEAGLSLCCFHPGSALGTDRNVAAQNMVRRLKPVFLKHPGVRIAIETMAGKGDELVVGLMEAKLALQGFAPLDNVGICLDTCHLWDSGEDLTDLDRFVAHVGQTIGLDRVFLIHLNDSKNPRGAAKDRHADIGEGAIGFKALCAIAGAPAFAKVAKILETPDPGDGSRHAKEIALIKAGLGF